MPQSSRYHQAQALLPAMIDAVQALVCVESPSDDVAACTEMAQTAVGVFEGWIPEPARVEWHEGRPAWRWGDDQPRVLLLGHLDTVWPHGSLARLPYSCDGKVLRGPGVFDMKAGVVQGWAALTLLQATEQSGIGVLLTTDEEIGSHSSRRLIADAIVRAEAVLVLEPSVDGALKTARKGTSWYTVDVRGRAAHAGLDPERGVNALVGAAQFALACGAWADATAGTTVTPTLLQAGSTANTVPGHASITLDVRAWSVAEQERIDAAVRAWRPGAPQAAADVSGGIDRPAMDEASVGDLYQRASDQAHLLGLAPIAGRAVGGASDGNLTAAAGVPTLDGLGAVGDGAHADHEWASVPAMAERAALLAAVLDSLLDQPAT